LCPASRAAHWRSEGNGVVSSTIPSHLPLRPPRTLCAAAATQFAVGGAVIPFATLLFQDRGLDLSQISLVLAASSATLMVFPFLWGLLADRFIALDRLFTLLNLGACAALLFLATQSSFLGILAGFTALTAFLNPTFMLINALSFHHLPKPHEQFGRVRSWGSLGWMAPFLPISLWLAAVGSGRLDFTLYLGMGLCLVMAGLTLRLPHTPPGSRPRRGLEPHRRYGPALRRLLGDLNYVTLLLAYFCVAGSFSLLTFYSFPLLESLGMARPWLGPVQALGVAFEWALFQWQGALLRRWNYTPIILAGCAALLLRQLLYATADNLWLLSLSYTLAGAVVALQFVGTSLLVNAMAGSEVRATAQTLLVLFGSGLGPTFANWAAGRISAHYANSLRPVFLFSALLAALAMLLITVRGRQLNHAGRHHR
jgi:MFS family permease